MVLCVLSCVYVSESICVCVCVCVCVYLVHNVFVLQLLQPVSCRLSLCSGVCPPDSAVCSHSSCPLQTAMQHRHTYSPCERVQISGTKHLFNSSHLKRYYCHLTDPSAKNSLNGIFNYFNTEYYITYRQIIYNLKKITLI